MGVFCKSENECGEVESTACSAVKYPRFSAVDSACSNVEERRFSAASKTQNDAGFSPCEPSSTMLP
jgi:hypothetical protein